MIAPSALTRDADHATDAARPDVIRLADMDPNTFVVELESLRDQGLAPLFATGHTSLAVDPTTGDPTRLLQVALVNEINVTELAASWIPTTPEIDVKLAFARQAGDESNHFRLVADRLTALGLDTSAFRAPPENALFGYMTALSSTVERVAAGLFTLESIAHGVNQTFIAYCAARGDHETVRIYEQYIQPDELAHQQMGRALLEKHAVTDAQRSAARAVVSRVAELAVSARGQAATKLGTACFPGC